MKHFKLIEAEISNEARDLNSIIEKSNPEIIAAFSQAGLRAYFPNQGIVKQSLEAKKLANKNNASIGVMLANNGQPMVFDEMKRLFEAMEIPLASGINYGGSAGLQPLREILRDQLGIGGIGLPVITSGLTHGLADAAALFCDKDTALVVHSFFWENIQLLFQSMFGAAMVAYPFYNSEQTGFNLEELGQAIEYAHTVVGKKRIVVYLNFPNNPTGYNLTDSEGTALRKVLHDVVEKNPGLNLVVICDEAYFGLSYEGATEKPIISYLIDVHPRLLTLGVKGPTKEVNVWGLRVGALWALPYGMKQEVIQALNEKFAGATRALISMPSVLGQELVQRIYLSAEYLHNVQTIKEVMNARAAILKEMLQQPKFREKLYLFPFNAGYFCCLKVREAEKIRQKLLQVGVGVISGFEYNAPVPGGCEFIRLAFSCLPRAKISEVLESILNVL